MLSEEINKQLDFIKQKIQAYQVEGKKIFVSSSFQTHSIPLLHIIASIDRSIPVYFLNTGFHFPETILFKNEIASLLNLQVNSLESSIPKFNQRDAKNRFFFCSNPNYCCHINKIQPLEPILQSNDIWITGVRRDQNSNRKGMAYEANGPFDTTRFHPMLDWNSKMIWEYQKHFGLPKHPLEDQGYLSVGCEPCTQKHIEGERGGRWAGMKKTECGLHTDLIKK